MQNLIKRNQINLMAQYLNRKINCKQTQWSNENSIRKSVCILHETQIIGTKVIFQLNWKIDDENINKKYDVYTESIEILWLFELFIVISFLYFFLVLCFRNSFAINTNINGWWHVLLDISHESFGFVLFSYCDFYYQSFV